MMMINIKGGRNTLSKKQERDDVEREFKDAIATNDKETKEYPRNEAEQRVKDCYPIEPVDVLIFRKGNNGDVGEMYNIFDIHEALQQLDEKSFLKNTRMKDLDQMN